MNSLTAPRQSPLGLFPGQPAPRLYDRLVEVLRTRHYNRRTEQAYLHWIHRLILFHARAHPRELARPRVEAKAGRAAATLLMAPLQGMVATRTDH